MATQALGKDLLIGAERNLLHGAGGPAKCAPNVSFPCSYGPD